MNRIKFYYRMFKTEFQFENYLLITTNECLQKQLSRFRLSSHHLEIEKGRHNGIIREVSEERLCKLFNPKAIESEYHFISCCPKYTVLCKRFNLYQVWPSLEKCNYIMKTNNKGKLINLMKYLKNAMILRNEELSVMQN